MNAPKFLLAAVAATLLSTASYAAPPSADQVTVPQSAPHHHGGAGKLKAAFTSPDQFMMFRIQMHQATQGMDRDHKKAYRQNQMQKIRAMTTHERGQWIQSLQAKWDALPSDQKARMEKHMARWESKRQQRHGGQDGMNQYQGGDDGQDYAQPDGGQPQMDQSR